MAIRSLLPRGRALSRIASSVLARPAEETAEDRLIAAIRARYGTPQRKGLHSWQSPYEGVTLASVAREFSVSIPRVSKIVHRKR